MSAALRLLVSDPPLWADRLETTREVLFCPPERSVIWSQLPPKADITIDTRAQLEQIKNVLSLRGSAANRNTIDAAATTRIRTLPAVRRYKTKGIRIQHPRNSFCKNLHDLLDGVKAQADKNVPSA